VARVYRNVLFADFLILAVFGLIYAATSNDKLYWIRPSLEQARAFGPYLNPTNFAGVMEMATPWLAGCALANWRRTRGDRLTELRAPMLAAGAVLCLTSALATASKASAVLLTVSLTLLGWAAVRGRRRKLALLGAVLLLCAGAVLTLRSTKLGERVEQFLDLTEGGYSELGRVVAWRASLPMLSDYAAVGCGFGSFRDVFPRYVPTGEALRWQQVHNDYLELLIEGGVVAGALLAWLIWAYWSRVLRGTRWRSEAGPNLEAIGLVLGLLSLSVHAFFDFNHQIPANALLFVTLAAMAMARSERAVRECPGGIGDSAYT
jgi:O-antigen ligase